MAGKNHEIGVQLCFGNEKQLILWKFIVYSSGYLPVTQFTCTRVLPSPYCLAFSSFTYVFANKKKKN
jgi:hypothetical protein